MQMVSMQGVTKPNKRQKTLSKTQNLVYSQAGKLQLQENVKNQ